MVPAAGQAVEPFDAQGAGAEDLGGRLVDEPDAVLRIHHDDALAQVLHDVLRQLRQVGEVHFLPEQGGQVAGDVAHQLTDRTLLRYRCRWRRGWLPT